MMMVLSELSTDGLVTTAKDPELVRYYPYPEEQDFAIDTAWTAQHAYNFMRATQVFGYGYRCRIGSHQYLLDKAIDYDNNDSLSAAEVKANKLYIPCNDGVLIATFTAKL